MTSDRYGRSPRPGLLAAIDARLRSNEKAVRAVMAVLGAALLAVLGAAAWTIVIDQPRPDQARVSDSREAYVRAVKQKIQRATDAALAGGNARLPPSSLKVRIQLDAAGNVAASQVMQSSGDPDLDALTLGIIRGAGPFGPFPPEMRRYTKTVELNSEFDFH